MDSAVFRRQVFSVTTSSSGTIINSRPAGEWTDGSVPDDGAVSEAMVARRRFTKYAAWAVGLITIPYLWIAWFLWESPNLLRQATYESNFYDLQARAMLSGHLWLPKGSIGLEGFFHGGREFTYFGIFPSILRIPVLLVAHVDSQLTTPSMLMAWCLTGLFVPLLVWRVRCLVRGSAAMGRAESLSLAVLVACCLGGTVFMQLASFPAVFSEDLAWSICLAIIGIFILLGILERPTGGQVVAGLFVVLAANLTRVTTGWALAGAAVLAALYLGVGRGGDRNRRWALPVLAVGLIPLIVACAVNYAKFGMLFGVSNFAQNWTNINAYRRQFLAANHNSESGSIFIPTTVLTYLRPDGLHLSSVFPFLSLPAAPPRPLGGVLFDRLYRTASIPASMPLLFVLGCWGTITAFRPHSVGRVHLTRILLLASAGAGAVLFGWGYIADRYRADFLPFFVLAGIIGAIDIWRRMDGRSTVVRRIVAGIFLVLGCVSVVANVGIAISPNEEWSAAQAAHFVQMQKLFSDVSGHPLQGQVHRGDTLPPWAPAGQLFVVGSCAGLYVSTGEDYSTVPAQQYQRTTWIPVERGEPFVHSFRATFHPTDTALYAELVSVGSQAISVGMKPAKEPGRMSVYFVVDRLVGSGVSLPVSVPVGSTHAIQVITDGAKHVEQVVLDGVVQWDSVLRGGGPIQVHAPTAGQVTPSSPLAVAYLPGTPTPALCRALNR